MCSNAIGSNTGRGRASETSIKVHLHIAVELLDENTSISDFGARAQMVFVEALRRRGCAAGTVKRTFATIKAAIQWAHRAEIIMAHPSFIRGLPDGEPRERIMTIVELARLWDAAEQPHLQAFIMGMIFRLECRQLRALIEKTRFAISNDQTRYYLGGICMLSARASPRLRSTAIG